MKKLLLNGLILFAFACLFFHELGLPTGWKHSDPVCLLAPATRVITNAPPPAPASQPRELKNLSILIVDDEEGISALAQDILESMGITDIRIALNGREGLDQYIERAADLVLTDRDMPLMNGEKMAAQIKALGKQVVVWMMTGRGEKDPLVLQFLQAKIIDGAIGKPFNLSGFRQAVRDIHTLFLNSATSGLEKRQLVEIAL